MRLCFLIVAAISGTAATAQSQPLPETCNVLEYGAIANDDLADTSAFQTAINACAGTGSTVHVPTGRYALGQLELKSDMALHLAAGAILKASPRLSDFAPQLAIDEAGRHRPFIYGAGVKNLSISGLGIIDGSGPDYWGKEDADRIRFGLIIQGCNNVKIRDISIRDTPMYLMGIKDCDNVVVDGVTLTAPQTSPNTDGLQIIDSHDVRISNCLISVGDDGIVPKMHKRMIERLQVTNCRISSDDGAIKFGTRSSSGIRDSLFSDIVITNSRYGVAMFMIHGGVYENVRFSNIRIETGGRHPRHYPIFIDVDDRAGNSDAQGTQMNPVGRIHGLTFDGIDITTSGNILIGGHPKSPITDLTLRNIRMRISTAQNISALAGKPRGNRRFLPVPGSPDHSDVNAHIVLGHVDGAVLTNVDVKELSEGDRRPALATPDSTNIKTDPPLAP